MIKPYEVIHHLYQVHTYDVILKAYYQFQGLHNLTVLKTDAFNEARNHYPIAPTMPYSKVTCLEIVPEFVQQAQANYPHLEIIEGDIQQIPKPDNHFNVILDFSTIDHVKDYPAVLDEYKRVLAPSGYLFIVVWFGKGTEANTELNDEWDGKQYFFDETRFVKELSRRFNIIQAGYFPEAYGTQFAGTNKFLGRFLCQNI